MRGMSWSCQQDRGQRFVLNQEPQGTRNLGSAIHDRFKPFGGFDVPEVPRFD